MPSLIQGRVIYPKIAIPDPRGKNPKPGRPFVVVTTNNDLKNGGAIRAVGITSSFDSSQTECCVPLPYGPNARFGLKRESAALCTWVIEISRENLDIGPGYIHPTLIDQIADKIENLKITPHVVQDDSR